MDLSHLDLTSAGEREYRRSIVMDRSSPEAYVRAWYFFRNWYLQDPDCPFFDDWSDPSRFHFHWPYFRAKYKRNIILAHRGSAKSTIIAKEIPLLDLVTVPGSKTLMICSTGEKVETKFDDLMWQIEGNKRIRDDFGILRPSRGGVGIWNRHQLVLNNGARLTGYGIGSGALRGERPHLAIIDDVEEDAKAGTNMDRVIADMELTLFKVILPMLRKRASLFWIGTPTSRRLFAWKLYSGNDPRLGSELWNRRKYPVVMPDGEIFWPGEYDSSFIEQRRRELGDHFMSEMMCEPGSYDEKPLRIDPIINTYKPVNPNEEIDYVQPFSNQHVNVEWYDCRTQKDYTIQAVKRVDDFTSMIAPMTRAITVDFAPTTKDSSDYSVVHVLGIDKFNQLWSLDMWQGRARSDQLIQRIWDMALRWRVRVVGIEAVSIQEEFMTRVKEMGEQMRASGIAAPGVIPIRYKSKLTKADRIGSLEWRFRRGLCKVPQYRENKWPYSQLIRQIQDFTPDLSGLEHDDAIDSLAMYTEVLKNTQRIPAGAKFATPLDMLNEGDLELPGGFPVAGALDITKVPVDVLLKGALKRMEEVDRYGRPQTFGGWQSAGL